MSSHTGNYVYTMERPTSSQPEVSVALAGVGLAAEKPAVGKPVGARPEKLPAELSAGGKSIEPDSESSRGRGRAKKGTRAMVRKKIKAWQVKQLELRDVQTTDAGGANFAENPLSLSGAEPESHNGAGTGVRERRRLHHHLEAFSFQAEDIGGDLSWHRATLDLSALYLGTDLEAPYSFSSNRTEANAGENHRDKHQATGFHIAGAV